MCGWPYLIALMGWDAISLVGMIMLRTGDCEVVDHVVKLVWDLKERHRLDVRQ